MQVIESTMSQRSQMALPSAAFVVDVRGISDDNVIKWLKMEITDLAGEMKSYDVYHWRNLTEFLSFRTAPTVREHETARDYRQPESEEREPDYGLTGLIPEQHPEDSFSFYNLRETTESEHMPFNLVEQTLNEMIDEINRIRNNRIAAVKDVPPSAIPGRSGQDATVRIIFLTDVTYSDSLTSAAYYAERLKNHYRKFDRPGHQPLVNITVLCLGNSGEAGPPTELIKGLSRNNSWDHLDSLILSENFREDGALIDGKAQAYIAELLLYVLLIIPPLGVRPVTTDDNRSKPHENGNEDQAKAEKKLSLPANTYVVGLAALEYSARWGHRWVNFGMAKEVIDVLRQKPASAGKEKVRLADMAESWFQGWCQQVRQTIPDAVPGTVPALRGIKNAYEAGRTQHVFTTREFNFHLGKGTIQDLERYLTRLEQTYVTTTSDAALQDALIQGSTQIMQTLRERDHLPLKERKMNRLGALQVEAEQVLAHEKFFTGATGSIPRACIELEALGSSIAHYQQKHQASDLNPVLMRDTMQQRQRKLHEVGTNKINTLKKHLARWPLLAGTSFMRRLLGGLTFLAIILLTVAIIFAGAAWLHHLIAERLTGLLGFVDASIPILDIPVLGLLAAVVAIFAAIGEAMLLYPLLLKASGFDRKGRGLYIELGFLIALAALGLMALFVSYSLANLGTLLNDPVSLQYLTWLAFYPAVGFFAIVVVLLALFVEFCYFFWWLGYLRRERQRIVRSLHRQHERDIQDVLDFIGDDVALELARRAELTDGNGGAGPYYERLLDLSNMLDKLATIAREQQKLAAERLLFNQSERQQGTTGQSEGTWLNLHTRDEALEVNKMIGRYKDLQEQLARENIALKEMAEFIVRVEGVEEASEIGQDILDRQETAGNEKRLSELFMASLAAITMRFAIDPLSIRTIDLESGYYQDIQQYLAAEVPALGWLVQTLNNRISKAVLQFSTEKEDDIQLDFGEAGREFAAHSMALWGELFWLHRDAGLRRILKLDGILAHLVRQLQGNYDPRAIMRRLLMHTALFGRSLRTGQKVEFYLLLAPSQQSGGFRQGLRSQTTPPIIDFPDVERILLLAARRFVAEPVILRELQQEPLRELPTGDSNGNGHQPVDVTGAAVVVPDDDLSAAAAGNGAVTGQVIDAQSQSNDAGNSSTIP